jgi:uncharacterized protein YgbK (DUF1537 family)
MIVVIADDLTGAAELGGLALRYNLVTEITNRIDTATQADLLIVATDTRSSSREEAERITAEVSKDLLKLKPSLIYKKTDSVLRGHVLAEINVQKAMLGLDRALIVAGNPGLGRTVVDGIYLMNSTPVHLSSFSEDPEFPIRSSSIEKMLRSAKGEITVLKHREPMPGKGIIVGEAMEASDLAAWCQLIDGHTLLAGAAEFFTAILEHLNIKHASPKENTAMLQLPALMVCGSSFQKSNGFLEKMQADGMPVSYIPGTVAQDFVKSQRAFDHWIDQTVDYLNQFGKAIIAVDPAMKGMAINALALRTKMAEATRIIAARVKINECLVEGGSTSATIMRKLGINTLYPMQELAPGVIRMGVEGRKDLHVTLKPGSYEWPSYILHPELVEGNYSIDCNVS